MTGTNTLNVASETLRPRRPSRTPRALALRLDRLARRAHAFHRFAHHPLCDRYANEVIRLRGRRRVCRGCTCAFAGAVAGLGIGAIIPLSFELSVWLAALGAVSTAMSVGRHPAKTAGGSRRSKLLTRALPIAGLSIALGWCMRVHDSRALALAAGILALAFVLHRYYQRRGPDRTPCRDCEERDRRVPCSGFRDIVRAERAFMRRSRALLET